MYKCSFGNKFTPVYLGKGNVGGVTCSPRDPNNFGLQTKHIHPKKQAMLPNDGGTLPIPPYRVNSLCIQKYACIRTIRVASSLSLYLHYLTKALLMKLTFRVNP